MQLALAKDGLVDDFIILSTMEEQRAKFDQLLQNLAIHSHHFVDK